MLLAAENANTDLPLLGFLQNPRVVNGDLVDYF
jgi:hypothetical protein